MYEVMKTSLDAKSIFPVVGKMTLKILRKLTSSLFHIFTPY